MSTRFSALVLALFYTALPGAAAAAGPLYKWVDEHGVTNYSNDPPPASHAASKIARVPNTMSVYTPDPELVQATKAMRERMLRALAQPEPPRAPAPPPVERVAVQQSGYEQCVESGRLGCEDLWSTYYPYYAAGAAYYPYYRMQARRPFAPRVTPRITPRGGRIGNIRR